MPDFPLPSGFKDVRTYWRHLLREGWKFRGFNKLPGAERARYKRRLQYEVDLIEQKGYENYFLIVADAITYIKDRGIPVGPARGSAAGSLAAYILRITEVDPLQFPLLIFERFIDITREDLPDIDIDFPSEVRDQGILRDYLATRYPSVANIGTFTYFKGKLALDDIARVYRVPKFEVEIIKNYLIERSSGDLRASATVEDTIEQFPQAADVVERYPDLRRAELLEGNVRGSGVHAAAYVVASSDIRDVAAIYHKKIGDTYADVVRQVRRRAPGSAEDGLPWTQHNERTLDDATLDRSDNRRSLQDTPR
jgi:DNA polymerase-3 subunit alpha